MITKRRRNLIFAVLLAAALWIWAATAFRASAQTEVNARLADRRARTVSLTVSPASLSFSATAGGPNPAAQSLSVTAERRTNFSVSWQGAWITASPSGNLRTDRTLSVSADISGLAAGTYSGSISLAAAGGTTTVPVTLVIAPSGGGAPPPTGGGYKLIGWNDLGMHCFDGKDYSIFAVLPPFNTIHAHLLDSAGKLITAPTGYTVTYQSINDPLTNTLNTTSAQKTNFWSFAQALGFGSLSPDVGLKGFAMPGPGNTPRAMTYSASDRTWLAEGIPITNYSDTSGVTNYFPMMRLIAKNGSGTVLASTDIVLPVSDEMTCSVCHASNAASAAARPASGWVNNSDPAKDVKLNILRKHDDRFKSTALFQSAAVNAGYSTAGLEATATAFPAKPVLCAGCHGTNALALPGYPGIPPLTAAMHRLHAGAVDPATGQSMESGTTRETCYRCHPGPKTQCLRGAMGSRKTATGAYEMECQSCHGGMSAMAAPERKGWLDMPTCQSCHTGTATNNNGQIVYTSVFTSGLTVRVAKDQTFATNPDTPGPGLSLYRFSSGHGGLQCEACHGSTHGEYATPVVNDNVQSTKLQGHSGMLVECSACHSTVPRTVTGGPHGMHPIGSQWVKDHHDVVSSGGAGQCQVCHGIDYRGTILSKAQADRTFGSRSFAAGTVIGCYSCHNGPH